MELTSYYESVFYISSSGDRYPCPDAGYPELKYEPQSPVYPGHAASDYSSYSPGGSLSSCEASPPASLCQHSSSSSSSATTSPPYMRTTPSHNFTQQSTTSESLNTGSKMPKIPPIEVLQQRRLAANARERKRANKINFAFNRLKKVLPGFTDREISKFEAIQLARDYIGKLSKMLEEDETQQACVRNVKSS